MLSTVATDVRLAIRRLAAAPIFTLFAILSLAVGIGVTTVAYSVVADFFFPRLGVPNADTVAVVAAPRSGRFMPAQLTASDFEQLRRAQQTLQGVAAATDLPTTVAGVDRTVSSRAEAVSGTYFATLGVDAAIGRVIQPADEQSGARVAVLGHALWRDRFASAPDVVGRVVRIGGQPFEIVGVAPDEFPGVISAPPAFYTSVWIPIGTEAQLSGGAMKMSGDRARYMVFGRLRSMTAIGAAAAEMAAIAAALDTSDPVTGDQGVSLAQGRRWTARRVPDLRAEQDATGRRLGFVVGGLVLMVLAVACTNLASLVLARGTNRQQDFVIRRALGASPLRLVREQLAESLIIAIAGGAASYAVMQTVAAAAARELVVVVSPAGFGRVALSVRPYVDAGMLATAAVALLVALVVFGLEPAIRLARASDVRGPLAATAARLGRKGRYRVLLRWQVAVSTAFFILAALAVRNVVADLRHDPGLRIDGLVVAQLDIDTQDESRIRRVLERIADEAQRTRRVTAVAVSSGLPFGIATPRASLTRPDIAGTAGTVDALLVAATPPIFAVTGLSMIHGRQFDSRDGAGAPSVVVVSETTARSLFGTLDVVGRTLSMQAGRAGETPDVVTIVGVAADTDTQTYLSSQRTPVVYVPLAQRLARPITVVARAADGEVAAIGALQAAIRQADPDIAVGAIGGGWDMLSGPFALVRFASTASASLGFLTLVLAMAGLYGIQSQNVTLRTREIGVRLSFGATTAQIRRMVLHEGFRPVLEGLTIGLVFGISGRIIIRAYLDRPLTILDPWMLALVPIPLVLGALCACALPAHRAARVDPQVALREL